MKDFQKNVVLSEIKNTLEKFTNKNLYECPCCECINEWDYKNYNPEECTYTCNECLNLFDENELQEVTFLDYITEIFINYKGVKDYE